MRLCNSAWGGDDGDAWPELRPLAGDLQPQKVTSDLPIEAVPKIEVVLHQIEEVLPQIEEVVPIEVVLP